MGSKFAVYLMKNGFLQICSMSEKCKLKVSKPFQALHLLSSVAKRENKNRRRDTEKLELLEGAENGRYKVVAKAEPYKNLPVSI
jgi:hypothetical protein